MNPILPRNEYIPDGEPHVWADGRLYLYGSRDRRGVEDYCSDQYKVFSTDDMVNWTDHGISFEGKQADFCPSDVLYAPDCAYKEGRYYLFYCLPGEGGREGVAVSDSPAGPFTDASPVEGADGSGIDPAVLVDDDGKAYLYWGQFELRVAQLADDMRSILPETMQVGVINEHKHGFCEGASIRKIGKKYYLIYCDMERGRATSLSYALGDTPYGPFEKQGVIVNNTNCDPLSWNIHGSLCRFKEQWYVFYHRSSNHSRYNRRACLEPITILPDGRIEEVHMSLRGASPIVRADQEIGAWRACSLYGKLHTQIEGDNEFLKSTGDGNIADFNDLDFSGEDSVRIRVRGCGKFFLNIDSAHNGFCAQIDCNSPDEWCAIEKPLDRPLKGRHSAHFFFAEGKMDVESMRFFKAS